MILKERHFLMKVEVLHEYLSDYREHYQLTALSDDPEDGPLELDFFDGEHEDNTLSRGFRDVFSIEELLDMAFQAGKRGETLEFVSINAEGK